MSRQGTPESQVLKAVIQYLEACNLGTVVRNSVGLLRAGKGRLVRFGTPGQADVTVELHGSPRCIHIECKAPGGRLSGNQVAWLEAQRGRGHVCIVAFSVQDVHAGLVEAGFQVPGPEVAA